MAGRARGRGRGALIERDYRRIRPAAWGYLVIAALQAIALARFPDRIHWSSPSTVVYVVVLATVAVAGVAGVIGVIGSTHKAIDPVGGRAHTGVQPPGR